MTLAPGGESEEAVDHPREGVLGVLCSRPVSRTYSSSSVRRGLGPEAPGDGNLDVLVEPAPIEVDATGEEELYLFDSIQ